MNRAKLKTYAPQARRDFIQAMTDRAAYFGLTAKKTEPVVEKGDVAVIGGRSFPIAFAKKRKALEDRIKRHGFEHTMEAMAYTWFNRLVAIRFMELHGYLDHGYRVLSPAKKSTTDNTDGTDKKNSSPSSSVSSVKSVVQIPEILVHAEHVELPGLKKEAVIDLKLAGNKEGELYRLLLTAQCNALHTAMPFLFEKIDDETELLLPDNLLNSDSLMRKLVGEIEEEDWNEVEIIGWLYQFYISEKKDEVIGKVVASEDIPAATQLFTPNWIVKYLVQNTLGRQWLEHHPDSPLKAKMEYYIEPAEQTPEVQEQLQEIIQQRALENRGVTTDNTDSTDERSHSVSSLSVSSVKSVVDLSLNPENLTLLDPACGSGHILVEAYDLFKAIYQERGYRAKDIPALILQKNLFGLEIDDRAAQLAAFALMMKARADDRRIFDSEAKLNILAFEDSQGMKASEIHFALMSPLKGEKEGGMESSAPDGHLFETDDNLFTRAEAAKAAASRTPTTVNFSQADIASLLELFENAKTFGSLIQVPPKLAAKLPEIEKRLNDVLTYGDLTHASAHVLKPLLQQARLLARQYDAVVVNPPYLGGKFLNPELKQFAKSYHKHTKGDLFAMFIERSLDLAHSRGDVAMVTMQVWMFISSFDELRKHIIDRRQIQSLVQIGFNSFPELNSKFALACAFVVSSQLVPGQNSVFIDLNSAPKSANKRDVFRRKLREKQRKCVNQRIFDSIPGFVFCYWIGEGLRQAFASGEQLSDIAEPKQGLATTDNNQFVRRWYEVDSGRIEYGISSCEEALQSRGKWFPYNKGGSYRKWYGNNEFIVNWENDGSEIKQNIIRKYPYLNGNPDFVAKNTGFYFRRGVTWSFIGLEFGARYSDTGFIFDVAGSSAFCEEEHLPTMLGFLNSSVASEFLKAENPTLNYQAGNIATLPWLREPLIAATGELRPLVTECIELSRQDTDWDECSPGFKTHPLRSYARPLIDDSWTAWQDDCEQATLTLRRAEEQINELIVIAYRLQDEVSTTVSDESSGLVVPDQEDDIQRFISYAIGCMMGRYSLDKPGLVYANSGNQGFDASQYKTFRADDDGIIPVLEADWGIRDGATNRIVEFVGVAWPKEHLEENLKFIADSIGPTGSEQPRDTIRRYLATGFYNRHLSMYKKRPIYWLFSSGKQRAFQCLVYLHRYHEGTLARMRTEYVIPLQGQIAARIEQLEGDKSKATSTSHRKKLQKEQDDLKKKQTELLTFEEKLKHAADQKISLDLDDGVKVNYAKFGDLLAESKAICGTKDED